MLRWILDRLLGRKPPMLRVGERAPAFEAVDQDGARVDSQALAGKRFVLWFYPKAGTSG